MKAIDEVREKTVEALQLGSNNVATMAVKMARMNWHFLIEQYEKGQSGLEPPFVVFREGPHQEADWGIGAECWLIPMEVYYFESINRYVNTKTVLATDDDDTISVGSEINMFVGQRLYFPAVDEYRRVVGINGQNITLDSNITLDQDEPVLSDVYNDVSARMVNLQNAFMPGTVFSHFQVPVSGTPTIDVSDYNAGNQIMEANNQPITCGLMEFQILVGRY